MNEQRIWLTTSLFCDKVHWGILLNKAVKAFIEGIKEESYFHSYYLELNYHGGDNIRCALLVDSEKAENMARETCLYFTTFFSKCDFTSRCLTLPIDNIFLPFPSKSIQFGLYLMPKAITEVSPSFLLTLSDITIAALNESEIDEETIFTVALYQYLGWIRAAMLFDDGDTTIKILNQFIVGQEMILAEDLTVNTLREKLETNKEIIQEIFFDMLHFEFQDNYDRIPGWSQKWVELCLQHLKYSDHESFSSFFLIPQIVNVQLGFNDKISALLNYMICSILQNEMSFRSNLERRLIMGKS